MVGETWVLSVHSRFGRATHWCLLPHVHLVFETEPSHVFQVFLDDSLALSSGIVVYMKYTDVNWVHSGSMAVVLSAPFSLDDPQLHSAIRHNTTRGASLESYVSVRSTKSDIDDADPWHPMPRLVHWLKSRVSTIRSHVVKDMGLIELMSAQQHR